MTRVVRATVHRLVETGCSSTHGYPTSIYAVWPTAREMLYLCAMSKARKRAGRRSRLGTIDRSATVDVVSQLECAVRNPHAALIGALIGGLVPWFARTLAHEEVPAAWSAGNLGLALAMVAVVLGCGVFSALTVYKFGRAAFGDERKALGFVLALEGVMLVSRGATSTAALVILIAINAVANGSVIALARDATRRQREADARRAVTRARNRADARASRGQIEHDGTAPTQSVPSATRLDAAGTTYQRNARTGDAPGYAIVRWSRARLDDAVDAEIVSEEKLLS